VWVKAEMGLDPAPAIPRPKASNTLILARSSATSISDALAMPVAKTVLPSCATERTTYCP
jgi:hypothetical protein